LHRRDGVEKNLAEAGGYRSHAGLDTARQLALGLLQALVDEIAGPENVSAVREDHRHLRQAVARQRTRVLQARQTRDGGLDEVVMRCSTSSGE